MFNIHIPSATYCPQSYTSDSTFNAHNSSRNSFTFDIQVSYGTSDKFIALNTFSMLAINQDSPNMLTSNGTIWFPDLLITNVHVVINAIWEPMATLSSDSLQIIVDPKEEFTKLTQYEYFCRTVLRNSSSITFTD